MKTLIRIISIACVSVTLASCSFLDENPTTQLSEKSVYNTEEALEAQVYGLLSGMVGSSGFNGRWHEYFMPVSGYVHWKGARTDTQWTSCLWLTKFSTDQYPSDVYNLIYAAVNKCNTLIDHLAESPVDTGFKEEIEGEAKFLRAVLYSTLVFCWGDIPLSIHQVQGAADVNKPRTVYYKVYAQIIKDLEDAEKMMRTHERQMAVSGNPNRPCRHSATAWKSYVYLYIGSLLSSPDDNFWDTTKPERIPDFKEIDIVTSEDAMKLALASAEKLIPESPNFDSTSPFRLAQYYADLFKWTTPDDFASPEAIFAFDSSTKAGGGSMLAKFSLPSYIEHSISAGSNWGRIRPSRWLFQTWCKTYNGKLKSGSGNFYLGCADPRMDATMYYGSYPSDYEGDVSIYPNKTGNADKENYPYFKKYYDPTFVDNNSSGNHRYYFMRLADVYLIAAEACASLCSTPGDEFGQKATEYVNYILTRARQTVDGEAPEPANWANDRFSTKNDMIHGIIWEREFELSFEGHEAFDTHRRGATFLRDHVSIPLNDFMYLPEQEKLGTRYPFEVEVARLDKSGTFKGKGYPEEISDLRKSLLFALPTTETTYNTSITSKDQNDFYWQ